MSWWLENPAIASYFAVFCSGWVTMLILVIPACLTASMTEAKGAKGDPLVGPQINNLAGWICIGLVQ
jgi:hypothetical protein